MQSDHMVVEQQNLHSGLALWSVCMALGFCSPKLQLTKHTSLLVWTEMMKRLTVHVSGCIGPRDHVFHLGRTGEELAKRRVEGDVVISYHGGTILGTEEAYLSMVICSATGMPNEDHPFLTL